MKKELSPLEEGRRREEELAEGLRRLAKAHGIAFRERLHINSNGEFSLSVSNGTERDGEKDPCGQYGEALAAILSKHGLRCGMFPSHHISPCNGWGYMNHFTVEEMLEEQKPS